MPDATPVHDIAPRSSSEPRTKILSFETWVSKLTWWKYAQRNPQFVPFPLSDRSPCQEPFFDPYAAPEQRTVVISGLCRLRKHFRIGERFLYVTRIDPKVARLLNLQEPPEKSLYFGVAALRVVDTARSHQEAAHRFFQRQYVPVPALTPYPPNLAHAPTPVATAARECSIVSLECGDCSEVQRTPDDATDDEYQRHYRDYHVRQNRDDLGAAFCVVERTADGAECLALTPDAAPQFTSADFGGRRGRLERSGNIISEEIAKGFRERFTAQPAHRLSTQSA